jgi:competence protein ComEC
VHAAGSDAAKPFCDSAALIVIADASAENPCGANAAVLTLRDLARHGSASVNFEGEGDRPVVRAVFAIDEPYRPWHTQRAFSREARGMPPYQGKPANRQPPSTAAPPATQTTAPGDPAPAQ